MVSPARKLLASGSGQCNLTHAGEVAGFLGHYGGGDRPGDAGRFLRTALYAFSNKALGAYCAERGVPLEEMLDGRVFLSSRRDRTCSTCSWLKRGVFVLNSGRAYESER